MINTKDLKRHLEDKEILDYIDRGLEEKNKANLIDVHYIETHLQKCTDCNDNYNKLKKADDLYYKNGMYQRRKILYQDKSDRFLEVLHTINKLSKKRD